MTKDQIKAMRLSRKETQAKFAAAVGTTVTTVARWETGKSKPLPVFVQTDWIKIRNCTETPVLIHAIHKEANNE